eukprot:11472074-Alexandrium_andersonii.AAC.1
MSCDFKTKAEAQGPVAGGCGQSVPTTLNISLLPSEKTPREARRPRRKARPLGGVPWAAAKGERLG